MHIQLLEVRTKRDDVYASGVKVSLRAGGMTKGCASTHGGKCNRIKLQVRRTFSGISFIPHYYYQQGVNVLVPILAKIPVLEIMVFHRKTVNLAIFSNITPIIGQCISVPPPCRVPHHNIGVPGCTLSMGHLDVTPTWGQKLNAVSLLEMPPEKKRNSRSNKPAEFKHSSMWPSALRLLRHHLNEKYLFR